MYAAQATACKQAYVGHLQREALTLARGDDTSRLSEWRLFFQAASRDYLRAYQEAHNELSGCCLFHPYSALSPKYRCSCGASVCECTCTYECACGVVVSKWSWQFLDMECGCECPPLQLHANSVASDDDWQRFVRYVRVSRDGTRSVAAWSFGDKQGTFQPMSSRLDGYPAGYNQFQ